MHSARRSAGTSRHQSGQSSLTPARTSAAAASSSFRPPNRQSDLQANQSTSRQSASVAPASPGNNKQYGSEQRINNAGCSSGIAQPTGLRRSRRHSKASSTAAHKSSSITTEMTEDVGRKRTTNTYDDVELSERTLDVRNNIISSWINDLEQQNKAVLATLANVERGVLEVSDTDQSVSAPMTTPFGASSRNKGSKTQATAPPSAGSSSRREADRSKDKPGSSTHQVVFGERREAPGGSHKSIPRSPGGGSIFSSVSNPAADEKDARIAELEGHVKSLCDQLEYLHEKEAKHAKECFCSGSTMASKRKPLLSDEMTQTDLPQPTQSSRTTVRHDSECTFSDFTHSKCGKTPISEGITQVVSEILSWFNICTCDEGRGRSRLGSTAQHSDSCFTFNKSAIKSCTCQEELMEVLTDVKAKLSASYHTPNPTAMSEQASAMALTYQQGQEISEMEDLIKQLKSDFSKIRAKCEDLLQQDPNTGLNSNDSGLGMSLSSPGSKSSVFYQNNNNKKVKESCMQLEAKIDKLSTFLGNLSERLWLSPAVSSLHLNGAETSEDEWKTAAKGRSSRGNTSSRRQESVDSAHMEKQLRERISELNVMQHILEEKDITIKNLTQELGHLQAASTPKPERQCWTCTHEDPVSPDEANQPCSRCQSPSGSDLQRVSSDWNLKREIRELRRQLSDLKEEKRLLELNLTSLQASHEALTQEVEGSKDDELSLAAHIEDLEKTNANLEDKLENITKAKRACEEKFRRKVKEVQEAQAQELAKYKEKCASQKSELTDVTQCLEKLQDDINHWQQEAERNKDNFQDLQQRYQELEQELANAREDSQRLRDENQELEDRLHAFQQELQDMKDELMSYKSNINQLAQENSDLQHQVQEAGENNRTANELEKEIRRLNNILVEKSDTVSKLQHDLTSLREHNSHVEFELNSSSQRLKQARTKCEDTERKMAELQQALDEGEQAEKDYRRSINEADERESKLQQRLSELEACKADNTKALERLQKENQKLMRVSEKSQHCVSDQLERLKKEVSDQLDIYSQREQRHIAEIRALKKELEDAQQTGRRMESEKQELTRNLQELRARCEKLENTAVMAQKFQSELSVVQSQVEEVCRQKSEAEAQAQRTAKKLKVLQEEVGNLKQEREKLTSTIQTLETTLEQAQRSTESKKAIREREKILTSLRESVTELDNRCRGLVEEVDRSRRQRRLLLKECEARTQELSEARQALSEVKAKTRESKKDANKTIVDLTNQMSMYKKKVDQLTSKLRQHEALFKKMRDRAFERNHSTTKQAKLSRSVSEDFLSGVENFDFDKDVSASNESLLFSP